MLKVSSHDSMNHLANVIVDKPSAIVAPSGYDVYEAC